MKRAIKNKRRKRNYKAEYARRKAIGLQKGWSLAKLRGHPKVEETYVAPKKLKPISDERFQIALQELKSGKSLTATAHSIGVTPERLRNQAALSGAIEQRGRRWVIRQDLPRRMKIFSEGRELKITVAQFEEASKVGKYMSAVAKFLRSNNKTYLKRFISKSVIDRDKKTHIFETRPNALYRLARAETESFEQVYRIVV